MELDEIKKRIVETLLPYNPIRIGVFGSYARGEQKVDSDIDILVELPNDATLLDLVSAERALEENLGIEVDLVSKGGMGHPLVTKSIEEDLILIYDGEEEPQLLRG